MKEITEQELKTIKNQKKTCIVQMGAGWCCKCSETKTKLENIEEEVKDNIDMYYLDLDKASDQLIDEYDIDELPVLVAFRNGKDLCTYNEKQMTIKEWLDFILW